MHNRIYILRGVDRYRSFCPTKLLVFVRIVGLRGWNLRGHPSWFFCDRVVSYFWVNLICIYEWDFWLYVEVVIFWCIEQIFEEAWCVDPIIWEWVGISCIIIDFIRLVFGGIFLDLFNLMVGIILELEGNCLHRLLFMEEVCFITFLRLWEMIAGFVSIYRNRTVEGVFLVVSGRHWTTCFHWLRGCWLSWRLECCCCWFVFEWWVEVFVVWRRVGRDSTLQVLKETL